MAQKHMTRPPAVAPAGRLTVQEAADALGMSYSGVYRHVTAGTVECVRDASGVITIARADLQKIKRAQRKPAAGDKRGIFLRPSAESVERWEKAIAATTKAGAEPPKLSRWLSDLADAAARRALA